MYAFTIPGQLPLFKDCSVRLADRFRYLDQYHMGGILDKIVKDRETVFLYRKLNLEKKGSNRVMQNGASPGP